MILDRDKVRMGFSVSERKFDYFNQVLVRVYA